MVIYTSTYVCWIYTDAIKQDAVTKTQEGRRMKDKDAGRLLYKYILPLTLLQGFERVVQGLRVRGSWRPNINCNFLTPLLWPSRCVFLVLLMLGSTPFGFPRAPSVGSGFPYHIWPLAVWNPTGNCFLDSNSTALNNNSTPTRSPTGPFSIAGHWNVSLSSGASPWNSIFWGRVEGQSITLVLGPCQRIKSLWNMKVTAMQLYLVHSEQSSKCCLGDWKNSK